LSGKPAPSTRGIEHNSRSPGLPVRNHAGERAVFAPEGTIESVHSPDDSAEILRSRLQDSVELRSIRLKPQPWTGRIAAVILESALAVSLVSPDSAMAMESLGEHFVNHAQRIEQGLDSRMQRFTGYPATFTPLVQKCDAHPGETR
jgi:hypothetical protein